MQESLTLNPITADVFAPHTHTQFTFLLSNGSSPTVTLTAVDRLHTSLPGQREPFRLTFVGTPGIVLPQSIYPLSHPEIGLLEIFLVPLGATPEMTTYEAIFA